MFQGIAQQRATLGDPRAPVTLVEYADLQCPYCAEWTRQTLPVIVSDYVRTGQVRIVFRGLAFLGADSELALRAVIAAGGQNKLWNLVDELYRRQGYENSDWVSEQLPAAVAAVPGLELQRLQQLGDDPATDRAMLHAARAAQRAGVEATPSFELGRTGGPLRLIRLRSLGPEGIRPALEAALTR